MSEKIFQSNSGVVSIGDTVLSFKDCPNKCRDGYYIDPYKHKRVKCSYCSDKRKQLAQEKVCLDDDKSISSILNIPVLLGGYGSLEFKTIVPTSSQYFSFDEPIQVMDNLFKLASNGDASNISYLFNLGKVSCVRNFINPYLVRSYVGGATVSPYLTARDVFNLSRKEAGLIAQTSDGVVGYDDDYIINNFSFNDFTRTDICVIHITTGSLYNQIRSVKGLMQIRANNNKSTIIFTDSWYTKFEIELRDAIQMLFTFDEPLDKGTAKLIKFKVIKDENEENSDLSYEQEGQLLARDRSSALVGKQPINKVSQESFNNLFRPQNNL